MQDDGGTANGGVDLDATPHTMTVNVTAVNDAPAGTNNTVTTLEDTAYTFGDGRLWLHRSRTMGRPTICSAVKISTLPGPGH